VELDWSGESAKSNESPSIDNGILIGELATNFYLVENRFKTDWYPTYQEIVDAKSESHKSYNELNSALRNLKIEIKNDAEEAMKQIGFEIKKFKDDTHLDWGYKDNNERNYIIVTNSKTIQLQYGRSQYETTYVNGFKVLGKKGNKYKVEVCKEGSPDRTFDVLEKKFEAFIEEVSRWENEEADNRAEKVKANYAERTKK
jgi:hypothetical protein